MPHIPGELYRTIFCHLAPPDLNRVGATSRAFHYETTPLLYRDIDLGNCTPMQLLSWANVVYHNAALAAIVRSLRLPHQLFPNDSEISEVEKEEAAQALTAAFKAVANLVALEIASPYRHWDAYAQGYIPWDCLLTAKFRLKSFRILGGALPSERRWVEFLSRQPEIEQWICYQSLPHISLDEQLLPSLLPRLSTFEISVNPDLEGICNYDILTIAVSWPLVRLCVHFLSTQWSFLKDSIGLPYFQARLTDYVSTVGPTDNLSIISQRLPTLKFLSYIEHRNSIKVRIFSSLLAYSVSYFPGHSRDHR